MNFESKKIELFCLAGNGKELSKKSRVMEYHCINGIDYGFYESKENKTFNAIHLDSGFAAVSFESKGYRQAAGFVALFEKVQAIPKEKYESVLPEVKRQIIKAGLTYPLND